MSAATADAHKGCLTPELHGHGPNHPHTHTHETGSVVATRRAKTSSSRSLAPPRSRYSTAPPQWQSFVFSSVSATIAAPFTNPFAVAKTQLQVQKGTGSARKFRGMVDFFGKAAVSHGGVGTIQRGCVPVMMREASKNLFRIGLYQPILGCIHDDDDGGGGGGGGGAAPIWKRMVAGAASGAVGAVACNPFEIVRIRVQAQSLESPLRPSVVMSRMWSEEGMKGFYKAGSASVLLGMVCTSVNLTTYTLFHETAVHSLGMEDGPVVDTSCALVSGFLAALAMNPVDVIRTRLMTQPSPPIYRGILDAAWKIGTTEGPSAFLKGFMPSFLRVGPHFVLTFLLLEQMRRMARKYNADRAREAYLTHMFRTIDADGSGEISRQELFDALLEADPDGDRKKAREETNTVFDLVDADGSGEIDLDEFMEASRTSHLDELLRGQQLLSTFRSFDTDGNGTIDEDELLVALGNIRRGPGAGATDAQKDEWERNLRKDVHKIMDAVDSDGDRTIDFSEFAVAYDKMNELEEHQLFEEVVMGSGVGIGD